MLSQAQRVSNTPFALLIRVVELLQAKILAIGQQAEEITGRMSAGNDHDLGNAHVHQRLDRVIDHGQVVHRQQMLVGHARQWQQTRTDSPGQNYSLHQPSKMAFRISLSAD